MRKYDELMTRALEILTDNDDTFTACVDELDSYNGYADGFRCFDMCELDDLFYGVKLSDFLGMITDNFDLRDDYFYESIYGIESTGSKVDLYRDNVDEGELLDSLLENYNRNGFDVKYIDDELDEILETLDSWDEDDETESEAV